MHNLKKHRNVERKNIVNYGIMIKRKSIEKEGSEEEKGGKNKKKIYIFIH